MNKVTFKSIFWLIALSCFLWVVIEGLPFRNMIPVFWGIFGFALNGLLSAIFSHKLREELKGYHFDFLQSKNIVISELGMARTEFMYQIKSHKSEILL